MNIRDDLSVLYVYDIAKLELRLTVASYGDSYARRDEDDELITPLLLVKGRPHLMSICLTISKSV